MVYGGDGLAFHEGRAVFVPFAAPGDRLLVQITADGKDYLRGAIVEILEPSNCRRAAPCAYFGTCGGCQLQHLNYSTQLQAKVEIVRESLRRISKIEWPGAIETISGPEWGYRIRAQLQVVSAGERPRVGYFQAGSHTLCDIDECPILCEELNECLGEIRSQPYEQLKNLTQIWLVAGSDRSCAADPPLTGGGASHARLQIGQWQYEVSPRSFFQANRFLMGQLIARVLGEHRGRSSLDLFSGVGFFAIPMAARFETVWGIEEDRRTITLARQNATFNGSKNCRFTLAKVEDWVLRATRRQSHFDLVVIDPPRMGLSRRVTRGLGMLAPPRLVYVSCNPTTFARDLGRLQLESYRLESLTAIDLFPQTYHVEIIAQLNRY